MSRFSKATVTAEIQKAINGLQEKYHFHKGFRSFNPSHGWAQIEGEDTEVHRDYGEFTALCDLADKLDLPVIKEGQGKRLVEVLAWAKVGSYCECWGEGQGNLFVIKEIKGDLAWLVSLDDGHDLGWKALKGCYSSGKAQRAENLAVRKG